MSLMMDALKKAQQLRSKESKGGPFFKSQGKNKKGFYQRPWMIIGGSAAGLCILLLILWKLFLMPIPPPRQIAMPLKGKVFPAAAGTISPEVKKETEKPKPVEEAKPSVTPVLQENERVTEKNKEDKTSVDPNPGEKIARSDQREKKPAVVEKPAPPPSFEKEETIPPPPHAKQESGKDLFQREVTRQFNAGTSFHNRGEWRKAIQAYQKVIEMDPAFVEAYNNLGILYQEMGDLDGALKSYQKAIEINPIYEKGLNNIGILLALRGENDRAMEMFLKVLAINPNHIESHIHLGTLYKKNGQLDKGVEFYLRALNINPLQPEAHYNLGLLYEQVGKTDLAVHHYRQFIHLSSGAYPDLVSRVRRHIDQLTRPKDMKKE